MAAQPAYKRVLLKLSGEALSGGTGFGIDFDVVDSVCKVIKKCVDSGVEVALVIGGGNFWRGAKNGVNLDRTRADHMGMMATVINSLAVADMIEQNGIQVVVQSALSIQSVAEPFVKANADKYLKEGKVVVFACGTGCPYFSTDTAAVLRAVEIGADAILLAKNVDAVYSADPKKDPNAKKYDSITYAEILDRGLAVMDFTATSLAMDNSMNVVLFALKDPENIYRVLMGEKIGTVIK